MAKNVKKALKDFWYGKPAAAVSAICMRTRLTSTSTESGAVSRTPCTTST